MWSCGAEEDIRAVAEAGGGRVHVKLDSGMGRLGTRDPEEASRVVALAVDTPGVELAGAMTHFATADDRDDPFFDRQLEAFSRWASDIKASHPGVLVHAANSAATLREKQAHFDMVRCGIAVYGMDPFGEDPSARGLEPGPGAGLLRGGGQAMRARPERRLREALRRQRDTFLGVLPIGYGDGWRRALSGNADVLVEGRRCPLVGTVSMDNLTVDLGDAPESVGLRGSEAVLLGAQGSERILAEEVAGAWRRSTTR